MSFSHKINGFEHKIAAVKSAIENGEPECGLIKLNDSIQIHHIMDRVRTKGEMTCISRGA